MNLSDEDRLERLTRAALRDLPLRRAPASLEGRVLAALARRALLPWWRLGFAHWPAAARAGFIVVSLGLIGAAAWALSGVDAPGFSYIQVTSWGGRRDLFVILAALATTASTVIQNINPGWFYGLLALVAAANAVLFGLGVTAYRVLHLARNPIALR